MVEKSQMAKYAELLAKNNPTALRIMMQRGDFERTDLKGAVLQHLDLVHSNLKGAKLNYVDFTGSNFEYSDFSESEMHDSKFMYTWFSYCKFIKVSAVDCNFTVAKLETSDCAQSSFVYCDFAEAGLSEVSFRNARLNSSIFAWAGLRNVDLTGANIDFASFPFWCGSLGMKIDAKIAAQMLYHFCSLQVDDPQIKSIQTYLYKTANKFHRVERGDCPRLTVN